MERRRETPARRGFTLLELVIVIGIIGFLIVLALDRLLGLRVEAERVAMEEVLGALRAGVAMELVSLVVQGRDGDLVRLDGGNPMDSLMQAPPNYLGEREAADPERIPAGSWYFDRGDRLLVYCVRYGKYFETELSGPARARFRLELVYRDRNADGRFEPEVDGLHGARIRAAEAYRWRHEALEATDLEKKR